ncbi:2OG-FeII_Oxy domain-containing protein/DIOX_N domain-containing protein [Cephalotus follicularis]|uniref:2OG-FeII_Oxy domain-containing protein/DIOX_N domain-containing protein n=1 Tax=Cephalotus follicularis TaxID=3775 RepID=A0A1Q3CPQ8_CEPFO|nr:2OG-FeII_Oxy domain-containing protein/DIOX_N domain-containing protein [Cephalotus follicularis]
MAMEQKVPKLNLGGSLLVPCVQELAREPLSTVPPRYVRADQDSVVISNTTSLTQVPVIDMQSLVSRDSELEKLHNACKEWGFFQLINHGVSSVLLEKVKVEIQELFNLPMEEKKKYWQQEGDMEGFGQAFVVSEEQRLDWADLFYMITLPTYLRKPHLFPRLPLPLRDTMEAYSSEMKNLSMKLLQLMELPLRMEPDHLKELFEQGWQAMRMNYYPPCPQPELAIGINPHSDATGLTILLQINDVEGLQIRKDKKWVPVKPLPNAFVINIGDVLEIVTNGIYRSIEHRATVNSEKERLSIATFFRPRLDGELTPAPSLITPETPALFKSIGATEYFNRFYSRELYGKAFLDLLRIPNEEGRNN